MSDRLLVDPERLHDLAAASRRARRAVEGEMDALRHGARDGGRAIQQATLEAGYDTLYKRSLGLLNDLADSLREFGLALDQIADGYAEADGGAGTLRHGSGSG